jgi:excisionase family DNA binding protein
MSSPAYPDVQLLLLEEAQDVLRVSYWTLRRLIAAGELEVVHVGRHSPRITPQSLSDFISRRTKTTK